MKMLHTNTTDITATRRSLPSTAILALLFALPCAATLNAQSWNQTAANTYNWTDTANWTGGVFPNSASATVTISTALTGNQIINVGQDITLGSLTFGSSSGTSTYTIDTGVNKLIFDNGASEATITHVSTGNNDIAPTGSSNIQLTSGGLRIINKGAGTLLSQFRPNITGTGDLTLDGNVTLNGAINNTGALNLVSDQGDPGTAFVGVIGANVTGLNINYASSSSTINVGGHNGDFSGNVNIEVGTVRVSNENAFNSTNTLIMTNSNDSVLDLHQSVTVAGLSGQGKLTAVGAFTLTLGGNTNNSFELVDFTTTGALALNVNLSANARQTFTGGRWLATGGVTITSGTFAVDSASTFSSSSIIPSLGTLLINGGTLATTVANTNIATNPDTSMQLTLQQGILAINETDVGSITIGNTDTASNFTMTGGKWEATIASASSFDKIIGKSNATFSITGGTLDLASSSIVYTSTYQVLSGFGSGSVSGLTITGYDTANWLASLDNTGLLSFSAATIPEPSTYGLLLGAGLGTVVVLSRRPRAQGTVKL